MASETRTQWSLALAAEALSRGIEGDFAEAGVYKGSARPFVRISRTAPPAQL